MEGVYSIGNISLYHHSFLMTMFVQTSALGMHLILSSYHLYFIEYPEFVSEKWKGISGRITKLTPDNITTKFSRLLKSSGITHFRFHDLRHYSASIQHALGIPDAYIMSRGGWGNDGVLKNVYRHAL